MIHSLMYSQPTSLSVSLARAPRWRAAGSSRAAAAAGAAAGGKQGIFFFLLRPFQIPRTWCQLLLIGTTAHFSTTTATATAWVQPYVHSTTRLPASIRRSAPGFPPVRSLGGGGSGGLLGLAPLSFSPTRRSSFTSASSSSSLAAATPTIEFGSLNDFEGVQYNTTVVIGRTDSLQQMLVEHRSTILNPIILGGGGNHGVGPPVLLLLPKAIAQRMIKAMDDKKGGSSSTLLLQQKMGDMEDQKEDQDEDSEDTVHTFSIGGLPCKDISRYNHPMSVHTLTKKVKALCPSKGNTRLIVLVPEEEEEEGASRIGPLASAIAKAFPVFSKKTTAESRKQSKNGSLMKSDSSSSSNNIHVTFVSAKDGSVLDDAASLQAARAVTSGVRLAARLVDSHPELLTTTQFAKEVQAMVDKFPDQITMTQLIGDQLREYGGLYGVGKAATCPPRLIVLEYKGTQQQEQPGAAGDNGNKNEAGAIALVGKGIVYDTGGLSLKSKTGMSGMKHDMAGAAGLLGGFYAAVQLGLPQKLYCVLCLAENAIGPTAFRNDDILTMYSGKTVEVNNCDAEGRLVLADGVAHVTKHLTDVNLIVDMATLTGAQLIATGQLHAGILANTVPVEERAMSAAMASGDLCFPLLYAPDLLLPEFASKVADMKNSVKDRNNAQTSCAGHFIEAHLDDDYNGGWLHIDMAGPGTSDQRGTAFGVGFVLSLLKAPGF